MKAALIGKVVVSVVVLGFVFSSSAFADTEPPLLHDARSVGMGGSGAAFIDSPAAAFHNPANIDGTKHYSLMLSATPAFGQLRAPFDGNPNDNIAPISEKSSVTVAPIFFLGGSYRIDDRLSLGLAAYTLGGVGGKYKNIDALGGVDWNLAVALGEISLPISFRITDKLVLGASFRLGFAIQQSDTPDPTTGTPLKQNTFDFGAPGVQFGFVYKPIKILRLAATYRSKMKFEPTGDLQTPAGNVDVKTEWYNPHALRFGTALSLLDERLLLALDVKLQFYGESHNIIPSTYNGAPGPSLVLNWKDTVTFMLGGEYKLTDAFSLRAGYALGTSGVKESTASPFLPTPGLLQAVTLGAGLDLDPWELGLAAAYNFAGYDVGQATANGGAPGHYGAKNVFVSLSGTYRY
ncbi:MAG: outer membrane protein transport protein [Myxococcales bacterium]|nr:MAG: outer membrane protein transport protein [Myxococcales bacterium]